jgi:hypothetical protein
MMGAGAATNHNDRLGAVKRERRAAAQGALKYASIDAIFRA